MHLQLHMYFIVHTYVFRSPSATILRVYSEFEAQQKDLCVAKILRNSVCIKRYYKTSSSWSSYNKI